jgi:hypothetical protein
MSAPKPQTEDKAKAESLKFLQSFADDAGLDLNSCSEQMFRVSPDYLTKEQRLELLRMILKNVNLLEGANHTHRCVECGDSMPCYDGKDCTTTEDECRACHEGLRGYRQSNTWLHKNEEVMQ